MVKVKNVYKSSDYTEKSTIPEIDPNEILFDTLNGFKVNVIRSFNGIQDDIVKVGHALKDFPGRSFLTVIGLGTVLYIAFKLIKKFGMIKSEIK